MDTPESLRTTYNEYNRESRIANSRVGCMLAVTLMPAGSALDYFVYPQHLGFFFLLRLLCSAFALVIWLLLGTELGRRHYRAFGMAWVILPLLFISLMIYFSEGVTSPYYAGLNLVLIAILWVAQVQFSEAVTAVLLTIVMYTLACLGNGATSTMFLFNNFYFLVLTGVVVAIGSFLLNRLRFQEFILRAEVDRSKKELEESNLRLIELDKAKSNFFANISHELRTPLTLLIGPLDKMRNPAVQVETHEKVELVDIMYNNAMRLLRLINDLLNLVRLDSGSLKLSVESVDIPAMLGGLIQSVAPMARQKKIDLQTDVRIESSTPGFLDRDKTEKIILNLVFNALKFTSADGQVKLSAWLEGEILHIDVSDTGKGMTPEEVPRVFDRFWQAETASTRRYQGVGIGLALVKELSELHGGGVTVESEVGKGTTMHVLLNVGRRSEEEHKPEQGWVAEKQEQSEWLSQLYRRAELFPAHVHGSESSAARQDRGKPRALIVDDEPEMRRFLISQLQSQFDIVEARHGGEAIEIASKGEFSLMLLDLMMPEIDGIEVARRVRAETSNTSVPIVILTARADEDSKMRALDAGATDFLTKPFASTELMVRCRNLVASYQLQRALVDKTTELEEALVQIKQTEVQLVHQAKMASLGQLSAGLMHEINNPLNFANTALHLLKKRVTKFAEADQETIKKPLADMYDGIQRVAGIITGLRGFTHPDTSSFSPVGVRDVVETAARFVQIHPKEIDLAIEIPPETKVIGNKNHLVHLLINIMQNSVDSLREKGAPSKHLRIGTTQNNGNVVLEVFDDGKGIPKESLGKIFDAFYTTKEVGSGVGLGLNISHKIIEQHGGTVDVDSTENEFCRFTIKLPASTH